MIGILNKITRELFSPAAAPIAALKKPASDSGAGLNRRDFLGALAIAPLALTAACKPQSSSTLKINPLAALEKEKFSTVNADGTIKSATVMDAELARRAKESLKLIEALKNSSPKIIQAQTALEKYIKRPSHHKESNDLIAAYKNIGAHYEALLFFARDFAVIASAFGITTINENTLIDKVRETGSVRVLADLDHSLVNLNVVLGYYSGLRSRETGIEAMQLLENVKAQLGLKDLSVVIDSDNRIQVSPNLVREIREALERMEPTAERSDDKPPIIAPTTRPGERVA